MTQSKKIAITGGIGSGKSTLCALFREKGYLVFSCDEIYRELLQNADYLKALERAFPDCFSEGKLDKKLLSDRVFSSPQERKRLEDLAHPRIMQMLLKRMEGCAVSFAEVPLLFERGYENSFDEVIALVRDEKLRIRAVVGRDGISQNDVRARISAQISPEELYKKRCIVIENNGDFNSLQRKAEAVLVSIFENGK